MLIATKCCLRLFNPLMPRLLVHTNFGYGLRLKLKGSISATIRPITTINTSIQSSIHCTSSLEKRGEKALQTSEIHSKTRRKASFRLSKTKRDCSRSVEQLRSSLFLESMGFFFLVTLSIECKAIQVAITTENDCSLRDAGPRADRPLKRALFLELVYFERMLQLDFTADSHKCHMSV